MCYINMFFGILMHISGLKAETQNAPVQVQLLICSPVCTNCLLAYVPVGTTFKRALCICICIYMCVKNLCIAARG